ncbi:hypothetical protein [Murimonas intestini]|uniref:Uncharacterized protein n=1 Tax=Murimonas intestini TaxID=1337051 RepID=A0AB73T1Q9_9FIRM|nr:hypothetical protein [Murimonas intestini]MCR1867113.1 hypothetical protein [Murimonas intestini]MCR1884299.1 hypothetical protein [Murimonas intestini]
MANSSIILSMKEKVIQELIDDEEIFRAIDSPDITDFNDSGRLDGTHIFRYRQHPDAVTGPITRLCIQVQIPEEEPVKNTALVSPVLKISIISHISCADMTASSGSKVSRIDHLSRLLDLKFNGREDFGLERLTFKASTEKCYGKDYLCRELSFTCKDLNLDTRRQNHASL